MSKKYLVVDAHEDIASNMLDAKRDYRRTVAQTRALEVGSAQVKRGGDTLLGRDAYQSGDVAFVFSTLFAAPIRAMRPGISENQKKNMYATIDEAHAIYQKEVEMYHQLVEESPEIFRLILNKKDYEQHLAAWQAKKESEELPTGLVILMECADGVRDVDELPEWWEMGVRLIGPAWIGTRFCGGTGEPGGLTKLGRELLVGMQEVGFGLDLSHMDRQAAFDSLDIYEGEILCSHLNAKEIGNAPNTNRLFEDDLLKEILKRDAVIGVVPYNRFLDGDWKDGDPRLSIDKVIKQIDHMCQLAGNSRQVGFGTDFDGGFGVQHTVAEFDSIADLQKVPEELTKLGYTEEDIANIMGLNWCRKLERILPE